MPKKKNPIEEWNELEKTSAERQAVDLNLWHQWDQSGRQPGELEPLVLRYDRFVHQQLKKKAPYMDESAFQSAIRNSIIDSMHSFDPNRGVALSTHVIGRARNAQRWLTDHANAAKMPEKKLRAIGPVQAASEDLLDRFGREPSHAEIAAHLTQTTGKPWRPKTVEEIQRLQSFRDIPMSAMPSVASATEVPRHMEIAGGMILRQEVAATVPAAHKDLVLKVYDHLWGLNGQPRITSTGELAKRYGSTASTISRLKTHIQNKAKQSL